MTASTSRVKETEDWKLNCWLEWRSKPVVTDCVCCNGRGFVGGHFKDINGRRECEECFGSGKTTLHPKTQPPEIPDDLVIAIKEVWDNYFNEPEKPTIECWCCDLKMTLEERSAEDGLCPRCHAEIDLE